MLSKLYYFLQGQLPPQPADRMAAERLLEWSYLQQGKEIKITPADGGTLGIVFHLKINGCSRFVKTHLPIETERENLVKQINILKFLYPDLHFQRIDLQNGSELQTYLVMDELTDPANDLDLQTVRRIIADYSEKLKDYSGLKKIPIHYHWQSMKLIGKDALKVFHEKALLSDRTFRAVSAFFEVIEEMSFQKKFRLCHGDLSSKNIMMLGDRPIVIDWEDAFLAFPEYDYFYWLTFFNNRKYYSQKIFENTQSGKTAGISVMLMILVLKSYLSYLNGSYLSNTLSFEDRLSEVIALE